MKIAWDAFFYVVIAAVVGSIVIVSMYSLGVRFLTDAQLIASKVKKKSNSGIGKEAFYRSVAYVFFALSALAVAFELLLIVAPLFHIELPFLPSKK
jgi:hypothetical protein